MLDPARFGRLARATWLEERRAWAWFLAVGVIVHCLLMMAMLLPEAGFRTLSIDLQLVVWIFGLVLTGPIFAGRYFQGMARRESALLLLTRPATAFEKWLLALVVVAIGYPLAYTLAFQVCNVPAGLIAAERASAWIAAHPADYRWMSLEEYGVLRPWQRLDAGDWTTLLLSVLSLQGYALLGSLYFHRWPFIKTLVTGFALFLVAITAAAISGSPDRFMGYWVNEAPAPAWLGVAWFAIPGLVWLAALFALRERQEA